MKEEIIRFVF